MAGNDLKSRKINHYIFEFQKIALGCDKIVLKGNFECQFKTSNVLYNF